MKKLCFLILAAAACFAFASTSTADAVPAGFNLEQVGTLQMLGFETPSWLVHTETNLRPRPNPNPHGNFPLHCPDYNNNYCTYQYDGGCCCVGTPTVPNSFCPDYCV